MTASKISFCDSHSSFSEAPGSAADSGGGCCWCDGRWSVHPLLLLLALPPLLLLLVLAPPLLLLALAPLLPLCPSPNQCFNSARSRPQKALL